jgi:hypothetical protein
MILARWRFVEGMKNELSDERRPSAGVRPPSPRTAWQGIFLLSFLSDEAERKADDPGQHVAEAQLRSVASGRVVCCFHFGRTAVFVSLRKITPEYDQGSSIVRVL